MELIEGRYVTMKDGRSILISQASSDPDPASESGDASESESESEST